MKKYYFTYKITNLLNGRFYLGMHSTEDLDDGYLGSGVAIQRAVRKYGKENFSKEILQFFDSYEEMAAGEKELVTEEVLKNPKCYNLTLGGKGSFSHIDVSKTQKDLWKDPSYRSNITAKSKRWTEKHPEEFRKVINLGKAAFLEKLEKDETFREQFKKTQSENGKRRWKSMSDNDRKEFSKRVSAGFSKEGLAALSAASKGYNNPDFVRRWKPFYLSLVSQGILKDLSSDTFDSDIEKKWKGFHLKNLLAFLEHEGIIRIIEEQRIKVPSGQRRLKTRIQILKENFNEDSGNC